MSEKTSVEQEQASNVLSDFKKAAHALLDALELGFFKRVSVLKSGAIHGCKTGPIAHVDRLEVKRFKNGEFHLKCQFFENSSEIQPKEYELEELRSGKGLFLDEKDAERLQLLANLKCLKEAQDQLEKRARKAQEKIGELEARIAEFGQLWYDSLCHQSTTISERKPPNIQAVLSHVHSRQGLQQKTLRLSS